MARHRRRDDADELPPPPVTRQGLREAGRLLGYLRPYRRKFIAAIAALGMSSACGLAFPAITGLLVNAAIAGHAAGEMVLSENVNSVALLLVGVLAVQAAFTFANSLWTVEVGERALADLRRDTYGHLVRLPMSFHVRRRVGEL